LRIAFLGFGEAAQAFCESLAGHNPILRFAAYDILLDTQGVGTALLQLCRLIGAVPRAVSSPGKGEALSRLGAQSVIDRSKVRD
jgi:hypothetical protein